MKRNIILSALILLAGLSGQNCIAATTASQTCTGTLGIMKQIITNGGGINSTIDVDTGALVTSFSPAFRITTNTNSSQTLHLSSSMNYSGGSDYAIFDNSNIRYIILTNNNILPDSGAILDIRAGSPTPANNANAIAYQVTEPTNQAGKLTYSWDYTNKYWTGTLTNKGNTDTALTIPAAGAVSGTYSSDDEPGNYQATITLSFV